MKSTHEVLIKKLPDSVPLENRRKYQALAIALLFSQVFVTIACLYEVRKQKKGGEGRGQGDVCGG
jgi:hypothetical protein